MRLPPLISLSLLLCAAPDLRAQLAPPDDFFHGGARLYISNNVAGAKEIVQQGRKLYPADEKLKQLEELLNQQNQQQQQDQSQQQKSDEQKDQPQKNSEEQKKQDEQKPTDPQKPQDQPKPDEQKKDGDQPDKKETEAQPAKPGEMTPEEAKRLLDAQKSHEQLLQLKPDAKPRNNSRPVKEW
jgi:outer membrane biosynthesis protein TonB